MTIFSFKSAAIYSPDHGPKSYKKNKLQNKSFNTWHTWINTYIEVSKIYNLIFHPSKCDYYWIVHSASAWLHIVNTATKSTFNIIFWIEIEDILLFHVSCVFLFFDLPILRLNFEYIYVCSWFSLHIRYYIFYTSKLRSTL